MPWYVLDVHHGPGHQSGHRDGTPYYSWEYHYAPEIPSKDDLREWFEHLTRDLENPIGSLLLVKNLPKEVRDSKISEYQDRIKSEKAILKELQEMQKVVKPRTPRFKGYGTCKGCGTGIHMTETYCGECLCKQAGNLEGKRA